MKKITLLLMFVALGSFLMAQTPVKNGGFMTGSKANQPTIKTTKAVGDTLMYFNGDFFDVNSTDEAGFGFLNEDLDNKATANNMCDQFCSYYSTDLVENGMPWDVDTCFFLRASSWFSTAGQADNWFSFGPITIPATGAIIKWYIRCNPAYRDGYKVKVSKTGMSNYTDFTGGYIYMRADMNPSATEATDTIWQSVQANIPASCAGQQTYFAFHHDANDMDVLWLDEVSVIAANNVGLAENSNESLEIYPNPASDVVKISNSQVIENVKVINALGQVVLENNANTKEVTLNVAELTSGIYFISVQTANENLTRKIYIQ